MPRITIYDPRGAKEAEGEVPAGISLLQASQQLGAKHGSACGGVCACSTCHCWVKKGFESLEEMGDCEADILDRAYDVKPYSAWAARRCSTGRRRVPDHRGIGEDVVRRAPQGTSPGEAKGLWPPK